MKQKKYGGAIWTNHALQRLDQRGLSQVIAWETFQKPDKTIPGKDKGTVECQKFYGKSKVTVVTKQNEKTEWIILSCWIDPPLTGYIDDKNRHYHKQFKGKSFLKQLWLEFKEILFGSSYR